MTKKEQIRLFLVLTQRQRNGTLTAKQRVLWLHLFNILGA